MTEVITRNVEYQIEFHKGLTVIDSVILADDTTLEGVWDQIVTAGAVTTVTI